MDVLVTMFFALDRGDWIMINLQVCMSNAIVAQIATTALNGLDGWQYFKLRTGVHCVSKPFTRDVFNKASGRSIGFYSTNKKQNTGDALDTVVTLYRGA